MALQAKIKKKFSGFTLDVEFETKEGCMGILGASGCGKSMTLKCIAGIEKPDSGRIVLNGRVLFDSEKKINLPVQKRNVGYLFQNYALFPTMTVEQNLMVVMGGKKEEKRTKIKEQLERFELSGLEKRYPSQLSGGMRQRAALIRTLLPEPELLLLDEPFSALDAKIRQQMREELKKIQSDLGITVIFVTHDQEEAMALSHRIVVMNKGKFDQVGTPGEIYDSPATLHVASFIGEMNFIRNGGSTIAVRPEDIVVNKGHGPMEAVVRTIMMLGHYVVLTVQRGNEIIKCYVDRELSDQLREGDLVNLTIGKHTVFSQAA